MAMFRVYHKQINQDFILVSAKDSLEAFEKAAKKMKRIYPLPTKIAPVDTRESIDCSGW